MSEAVPIGHAGARPARPMLVSATPPDRVDAHRRRWRRQASITTAAGIAARGLAIPVRLLTIPLALRLLGPERYGLWLSIGSMLAWIGFVGPGLGYGLVNAVSDASGRDDEQALRRHVSTAVFTLLTAGFVFLSFSPLLRHMPGVVHLLGISNRPDLLSDARVLLSVTAMLFGASLMLEFVSPLCTGLQEGYLASAAAVAASLGTLGGVLMLALRGGSLVTFALVVGVPPIAANLALAFYLFFWRHPRLRPSIGLLNGVSFRALMGFGGWMFVTQVGDLAIFQSANLLIASHFGPAEVPRYAVPASVFMNVSTLCFLIVQPYWPAMKEATVRGDWDFIRITTARTLPLRLAIMLAAALFTITAGPPLIRLWAGEATVPGRALLGAMGGYYLLVVLSGHYVILLLSFGMARMKAMLTLMVGVAHVGGFILLSPVLGILAMPVAGAVGVLGDCLFAFRASRRFMRERARG